MDKVQESRKILEDNINSICSELFAVDRQKDNVRYDELRGKLLLACYDYIVGENNQKFGKEIWETFDRCINSFDPSSGVFSHYLNVSVKNVLKKAGEKEYYEEKFHGATGLSRRQIKSVREYIEYALSLGKDPESNSAVEAYANMIGVKIADFREWVRLYNTSFKSEDALYAVEAGEGSTHNGKAMVIANGGTADEINSRYEYERILDVIEEIFVKSKARRKLLSMLLTAKLLTELPDESYIEYYRGKTFVNKSVMAYFITEHKIPSGTAIVRTCDKNINTEKEIQTALSSASNMFKNFAKTLNKALKSDS